MASNSLASILGASELDTPQQIATRSAGGDPAVWTVLGEAGGNREGQRAVASTIAHRRLRSGANTAADIVTDRAQGYEAWNAHAADLQRRYPIGSPAYRAAEDNVQGILAGSEPPPYPYYSFYSPTAQAQLSKTDGRPAKARFDDGTGVDIGGNRFFTNPGVSADLTHALGIHNDLDANGQPVRLTPTAGTPKPGPTADPQADAVRFLSAHGFFNPNAPIGSSTNPRGETATSGAPKEAGTWYVSRQGELKQAGTEGDFLPYYRGLASNAAVAKAQPASERLFGSEGISTTGKQAPGGVTQGLVDTAGGVNRLTAGGLAYPASENGLPVGALSDLINPGLSQQGRGALDSFFQGERNKYDLVRPNDPVAAAGRFAAQAAPATLATAAVPEIALPGRAGAGVLGALSRGAGTVATNAVRGAASVVPTLSTTDAPVSEQLGLGAGAGIVLPPILSAFGHGASAAAGATGKIIEPLTESGRGKIADRMIRARAAGSNVKDPDLTEYVPGSRPTTAEALGNTGLSIAQRAMTNTERFAEQHRANQSARSAVVAGLQGDDARLASLESHRDSVAGPLRDDAFANAQPTDSTDVIRAIDAQLATPGGQELGARQALMAAKKSIMGTEKGLSPEQQTEFETRAAEAMGQNATNITRPVMAQAKKDIGSKLDEVAARTPITDTDTLLSNLGSVVYDAQQVLPESDVKPLLNQVQNIASTINNGQISGESYQALTRTGTPLDVLTSSSNSNVGHYARQIEAQLQASLQNSASPEDAAMLSQARNQWRNMRLIEAAHGSSLPGEALDPERLYGQVAKQSNNFAYRGGGDLGDVAEHYALAAQPRTVTQTDPVLLHGIRSDLAAWIDKGGDAASQLTPVHDALVNAIEQGAPGYGDYLNVHNSLSQPINEHRFLRGLTLSLPGTGDITSNRVGTALQTIERMRQQPGVNAASSLSPQTMDTLQNLHLDLQRQAQSGSLGRGVGSDTVQKGVENMATGGMDIHPLVQMAGLHNPVFAAAGALSKGFYMGQGRKVMDAYADRLIDPELGMAALQEPVSSPVKSALSGAWNLSSPTHIPLSALGLDKYFTSPSVNVPAQIGPTVSSIGTPTQ